MNAYAALKNFITKCITPNGPMSYQYSTDAGTRRDSIHTPLDYLTHSGLEQETLEIRIPSCWPCETLIEVKVITGEGKATPIIQEKITTDIAGMF